ncbi:hypothetical protein [Lactiplantibacillus plantarum]|uniref:hypothetical protein n=2 Tax=Lactiplantibacillus plantarum TaxID=1590 RepID=UPI0012BA061A|nr:hypothetical protein [Lactiplantibacillus plantarum]
MMRFKFQGTLTFHSEVFDNMVETIRQQLDWQNINYNDAVIDRVEKKLMIIVDTEANKLKTLN